MAALNFPNSPNLNDTHTENGVTFKWNGAAWDRLGDIGAQGATGSTGAQGSTGPVAGSSSQVVYKDGSNNPAGSSSFTFDGTNLTVGGNVSIGGTLTYEDVTNIDSVGVVTARAGVRVTGGSVGIGTDNPSAKLDVYKNFSGIGAGTYTGRIYGTDTGVNETGVRFVTKGTGDLHNASDAYLMHGISNGTTRFVFGANGSVGIGTDNPQTKLEIQHIASRRHQFSYDDSLLTIKGANQNGNPETLRIIGGDSLRFHTGLTGSGTERLRIDSKGQASLRGSTTAFDGTGGLDALQMYYETDSGQASIGPYSSGGSTHLSFYTNSGGAAATEKLRIDSSGNLTAVNTSSGGAVTLKVGANATSGVNNGTIIINNGGTGDGALQFDYENSAARAKIYVYRSEQQLRFDTAGSERLRVTSAGEVYIGSTTANGQGKLFVNDSSGATTTRVHIRNAVSTGTAETYYNLDGTKFASVGLEDGSLIFRNSTSSTPTERLRVNASGTLIVASGGNLQMASNGRIFVGNGGNAVNPMFANVSDTNTGIAFPSADTMMFTTGGIERLRITSDGKLMTPPTGYIYTGSSAGSLSLYGGNTNLGGGIVLSGGNTNGDIRFYAQMSTTSPAHRMTIGTTGQVEVSNTVSSNDAAVNIYKASGSNSDKAILRVGYDAAAAFEIYRIRNNGDIFVGPNQSGSDLILQNVPTGGSTTERLRIQENGDIGVGGITSPSFTTGGGIHLKRNYGIGFGDGSNGRPDFQLATPDGSTLDFRCGFGADTADIQMTTGGVLRLGNSIASLAGDNSLTDFSAGRVQATRFRRGTSNGSRYGGPTGYIGDMLSSDGPPLSHVFYMGQLNSSSSSNASQNMFSYYTSGHWGQYTSMRVWMHVDYYNHGYQVWDVYNGSITSIANRGSGGSLTSSSAQLVGSGTHGGQNVYRYDVTVNNPGTYFQVRWYLGLYFGAANGVYSNAYSASSMDTYLSTRGSGIHFKGLSAAALSSCPLYRTQ